MKKYFKRFASKNQLPGLFISGTLVENGLTRRQPGNFFGSHSLKWSLQQFFKTILLASSSVVRSSGKCLQFNYHQYFQHFQLHFPTGGIIFLYSTIFLKETYFQRVKYQLTVMLNVSLLIVHRIKSRTLTFKKSFAKLKICPALFEKNPPFVCLVFKIENK